MSRGRRDAFASRLGLFTPPLLGEGNFTAVALRKLIGRSRLGDVSAEGIYLRWDEGDWLVARAKVVREGWLMAPDEHWSARPLKTNELATSALLGDPAARPTVTD